MLKRFFALAACAVLLGASAAYAQETTGTIVGTVKDATGAAVAGATVTITDTEQKAVVRTLTTDAEGNFQPSINHYKVPEITLLGEMREQFRDFHPALAAFLELPRTA